MIPKVSRGPGSSETFVWMTGGQDPSFSPMGTSHRPRTVITVFTETWIYASLCQVRLMTDIQVIVLDFVLALAHARVPACRVDGKSVGGSTCNVTA